MIKYYSIFNINMDEITYRMYDRIITNSLKNLKKYSERTKYQNKD